MAPLLPDELWKMIFEFTAETGVSTLRSLLLVSNHFHLLAEPVLLDDVVIFVCHRRDYGSAKLIAFRDFIISGSGHRCLRVKRLSVHFLKEPMISQDIIILDELIPQLTQLKSLSLEMDIYVAAEHGEFALFDKQAFDFSLKHFEFKYGEYDSTPDVSRFLASQPSLQCLELLIDPTSVSFPSFQHLRHLHVPIEVAIGPLSSIASITSLKTYFLDSSLAVVDRKSCLNSLQMMCCVVCDKNVFFEFLSLEMNVKSLAIYSDSAWDSLDKIRGARIEHIRFVHSADWTAAHIQKLFKSASFLPSLRCIEVQGNSRIYSSPSLALRWYPSQEEPVAVEWQCYSGDEWHYDWEADVRVLS